MDYCFCTTCGRVKIEKRRFCDPQVSLEDDMLAFCDKLIFDTAMGLDTYCMKVLMDPDGTGETGIWVHVACRHCPGDPLRPMDELIYHAQHECPVTRFPEDYE